MTREADGVLYTRAGTEVSVPATKTFVAQVAAFYLLALRLAELRGTLAGEQLTSLIREVKHLPHLISETLDAGTAEIERIAASVSACNFFMYLGRNAGLPIALEGALKLKEVSYLATDAYAAGEMKHGPIALLDKTTPVIAVATESAVLEKLISNIQEVRARGARVIGIATEGNIEIGEHCDEVIRVPAANSMLSPLLAVIPLQLLAYFIATQRGLNVDQPRNLAAAGLRAATGT
jgi:glucosamine--fructose-6-phosphate aminotransferase (isomerizing)